jgi:hypothetical protein
MVETELAEARSSSRAEQVLTPLEPLTAVRVHADGVDVDDFSLVMSWPEARRDAFLQTLAPEDRAGEPFSLKRVVTLQGFESLPGSGESPQMASFEFRELRLVLEYAAQLETSYRASSGETVDTLGLSVFFDRATPYDLVARVLYTAGQAGYGRFGLVTRHRGRARVLWLDPPSHLSGPPGHRPPRLVVRPEGIEVALPAGAAREQAGTLVDLGGGTGRKRSLVHAPPFPSKDHQALHGPGGACPAIGRVGPEIDMEALASFLRRLDDVTYGESLELGAFGTLRWDELSVVAQAIVEDTPFTALSLRLPTAPGTPLLDCGDSVDVSDLEALPWR